MPYASNKNAVAICNRSGAKMMRADMVEDGYLKGLLVHPDWYDPPHPQEQPFDPDEGIAIYRPAPDLVPNPPGPTALVKSLTGGSPGFINVNFTFQQPDPPASTIVLWQLWRSPAQVQPLFVQVAQSLPIVPIDFFIQETDRIAGDAFSPVVLGGRSLTDTAALAGASYFYYLIAVTADTSTENGNGLASAPSFINANGVTVSGTPTGLGGNPATTPQTVIALPALFIGAQGAAPTTAGTNKYPYSPDGLTWNIGTCTPASAANALLGGPAWSPALGLWAMPDGEASVVTRAMYTSPDGLNWTARTMPAVAGWTSVAWSPKLALFCAVATNNSHIATSPDGITWTAQTAANVHAARVIWAPALNSGNGYFVAGAGWSIGSSEAQYSADGITWTAGSNPSGASIIGNLAASATQIVGGIMGNTGQNCSSPDGINWSRNIGFSGTVSGQSFDNMVFVPGAGGANGRFVSYNPGAAAAPLGTDYLDGAGNANGAWSKFTGNVTPTPVINNRHYCGAAYSAALGVIVVMEESNGVAYNDELRIVRSADNGATWQAITMPVGLPEGAPGRWSGWYVAAAK